MASAPLLRLCGVAKAFTVAGRAQPVLQGVDMQLRSGEVLALLGSSGSGKSTLLNLIAGLEESDRGSVELHGAPFSSLGDRARTLIRRRDIGLVFQFFNLIPTLNVAQNLSLPLRLNGLAVDEAEIGRLLQQLGLPNCEDRYPEQLSGGEQQRVAIGRAMIHRPRLLLADEPTGNLDNASADQVTDLLFEQVRDKNQSLLLVTHNETLAARADRVVRLYQGRLIPAMPAADQGKG